jgi:3-hydroxyisobutyrate dehydrogenase-like beta-hydroxyacid dehydrogenase
VEGTVAEAEVVFVVVLNDQQLRSVCLGPGGALGAMPAGSTLVQHTTSDPETAQLLAGAGAARGIGVLDAALSGGPQDIAAGSLTLWVGGDPELFEAHRPLLETYATPVTLVGPVGNGQRVKLVNNALFVAQVGLAIDAVRLAGSLGIAEQTILGALQQGSGASRSLSVLAGAGSVAAVTERLAALMSKDVDVVREVARSAGVELGLLGTVLSSGAVEEQVLGRPRSSDSPT